MRLALREKPPGFTLIEVVISAALMALILVSAYLCLQAAFASQKMVEPRADLLQNARVAAALLTADLRNACPLSKEVPFLGMHRMLGDMEADNLDFATHNYTPRGPHQGDFCEISYFLDKDPETGQFALWRRRNPTMALDLLSGGGREEIAVGLAGVRFEYFDGFDWLESWGNSEDLGEGHVSTRNESTLVSLPEAVRITLLFSQEPRPTGPRGAEPALPTPPFVFQTVARLMLTERSAGTNASSQGASSLRAGPERPGI